jgi:two-component system, OmpR family, response regulator TctD
MKILLVEDNEAMRTTLARTLGLRGMQVSTCADGLQALAAWQASAPDVVLLDLSLPGRDGLQVLSDARKLGLATPVLILTARGTVGDRILGLNTGADDYLPKPFDLDELEARVRALGRAAARGQRTLEANEKFPDMAEAQLAASRREIGSISFEKDSGAFYHQGLPLELSSREATLLAALFERAGHAVTKEKLFERVFPGTVDVQYEAIEVVAYRLRKKLQGTGAKLVTLRGLGYLLKAEG